MENPKMSCSQEAWQAAANEYNEAMGTVKASCESVDAATTKVAEAEEALLQANSELDAATQNYESAQRTASNRQATMVAEAEKLGVDGATPTHLPS